MRLNVYILATVFIQCNDLSFVHCNGFPSTQSASSTSSQPTEFQMSILVIGSTGTIGSLVVQGLAQQGADVSAMVRTVGKASLPAGVNGVVGDLADVASLRKAFAGVRTLF